MNNKETEIDIVTGKSLNEDQLDSTTPDVDENIILPGHGQLSSEIATIGKDMSDVDFINALAEAPHDLLIPWEDCILPSGGLYYKGWSNGVVNVRAMTQSVEKIFANKRFTSSGQALDAMFRKCCQFPGDMDPSELLIGDRTFLLYYIRGITYGNEYKFVLTCPHCGAQNTHVYDMNELYSTVIPANTKLGPEPFKVVLPHLSEISRREVWVSVRFLRSGDISDILSRQKFNRNLNNSVKTTNKRKVPGRINRQDQSDQSEAILDGTLEKTITSVNGVSNPIVIQSIVSKLHSKDNAAIREFLRENTPGIDSTVTIICKECQNEVTMELPVTDGFFRSTK